MKANLLLTLALFIVIGSATSLYAQKISARVGVHAKGFKEASIDSLLADTASAEEFWMVKNHGVRAYTEDGDAIAIDSGSEVWGLHAYQGNYHYYDGVWLHIYHIVDLDSTERAVDAYIPLPVLRNYTAESKARRAAKAKAELMKVLNMWKEIGIGLLMIAGMVMLVRFLIRFFDKRYQITTSPGRFTS